MSQAGYELFISLCDLYCVLLQVMLFLVIWDIFFRPERGKRKENVAMEVGTVYGGYYGAKGYGDVRKEEKRADAGFAGKVAEKGTVSPKDMTLDEYKAYFNEKMNSQYVHPSQRNRNDVIDITDAAYKRMQTDPEYEKKILDALAKNKAVDFGGNIPEIPGVLPQRSLMLGGRKRQGRRNCWKNIWKSGRRLRDSSRWRRLPVPMNGI